MNPPQGTEPLPAPSLLEQLRAGALAGSRRLSLSCGLETFPPEIFTLADTLEILDLSGNALSALPHDLARLHRLRIIFCSNNRFTEVPAVLGQCAQLEMIGFRANQIRHVPGAALPPRLRALVLTDNQIDTLPAALGRCTRLQKLMLAGNRLHALPPEMAACTRLELLRIAANRFTALPGWLLALPRLAWLAYAGNPLSDAGEAAALADAPLARIDWASLQLGPVLGEGASGVIRQALWQQGSAALPVAVKVFKGALTSDGLPAHEMAACIGAGAHPALIAVHGRITHHPAGSDGLVMALVAPHFGNLAAPPSLDTCTRDVYDAATRFTPSAALRLAQDVASAAGQLHARGVLHGDLYAHNILCAAGGQALLGDFGAASFFPPDDAPLALALQRIEARAFSCLLEELLACCPAPAGARQAALAMLADLQADCALEDTARRPLFSDIVQRLAQCRQAC
ncbi:leucine-rich repeat-containing protein kinase family protein [Polaromonas glacialis]|uniref:leucine-rich repeat-containing protein kinase family protein n=1 Tax=Polaromonas glacialis TaxID=866564 RepID=UPI00068A38AF|nr:leucine-rich repeat-containing protein kinase family protein [Polaromonas glacialis]